MEVDMTKKELIKELKKLQSNEDTEEAHVEADHLLIKYIKDADIGKEYRAIKKWYA
jgi:hypothetical protein